MHFVSPNVTSDSVALIHYGGTGDYAIKKIEYIGKSFESITFTPQGDTRETYYPDRKVVETAPMRHVAGEKPSLSYAGASIVAIGGAEALMRMKKVYTEISSLAKPISADHPAAALLYMAKKAPHVMTEQQLMGLERFLPMLHKALINAAKQYAREYKRLAPKSKPPYRYPFVRLAGANLCAYAGECLQVVFQDTPEKPEFYWIIGGASVGMYVKDMCGSANSRNISRVISQYEDNAFLAMRSTDSTGRSSQRIIESIQVMPAIYSEPVTKPFPLVFILNGGEWEEQYHAVEVNGPDSLGNISITHSDTSHTVVHYSRVKIEYP